MNGNEREWSVAGVTMQAARAAAAALSVAPLRRLLVAALASLLTACATTAYAAPPREETSMFFPSSLVERARVNARKHPWAGRMQKEIVAAAEPWRKLSDDALWDLMFGSTITRSWMVWSNGHCPACKASVPMYTWGIDALNQPWKVRCPHCRELFPKNDFARFYRSGLDERGVFDPKRADRSLLINAEHPDPADPLHRFGVDDGEGYVEGEKRWRFIGAYLIYGQWKQAILGGIKSLGAAYVVTGDPLYAHKAGVLLDRVADLYPTFDFAREGRVYEKQGAAGYVSTWHDACEETRDLAFAYDQVRGALPEDPELVRFLSGRAARFGLENRKATVADIRRNIEERILRDAVTNRAKIASNYPTTEVTIAVIRAILDWPEKRAEVEALLDAIITRCTAVDGMTGEKGLAGYSVIGPRILGTLLACFSRVEPGFLEGVLKRHPRLHQTYRFHVETWCLERYYPTCGDSGSFGMPVLTYLGLNLGGIPLVKTLSVTASVMPSHHDFLWQVHKAAGDPALAQALYLSNGSRVQGLPYDLFAEDPERMQGELSAVIAREGARPKLASVNKREWRLGILRSGAGSHARAAWLDYDAGGGHGHMDALNLGLFARGLDLLPDFGYPPVHHGGWGGAKFAWYVMSAGHNTVVVDGRNQTAAPGETTLWADGKGLHAIRASVPKAVGAERFERTVALVDLSEDSFYLLDVFRVAGGKDHAWFLHSNFGRVTPEGLSLAPAPGYGFGTQMRAFRTDPSPDPGWNVDWEIEDRYGYAPRKQETHLRCTGLTPGAAVSLAEAWIAPEGFNSSAEAWIPRLMVRRQVEAGPLASTFVTVIEAYGRRPALRAIRRLPLAAPATDADVAVEVALPNGERDLLVAADAPGERVLQQEEWELRLEGDLCQVRRGRGGAVRRVSLCRGTSLQVGDFALRLKRPADLIEIAIDRGRPRLLTGDADAVEELTIGGKKAAL